MSQIQQSPQRQARPPHPQSRLSSAAHLSASTTAGTRAPPMAPPGMPVRADQAKAQQRDVVFPARPSHPQPHSPAHAQAQMHSQPGAHHRSSMPNPAQRTQSVDPRQQGDRLPKMNHASISSRPTPNRNPSSTQPRPHSHVYNQAQGNSSLRETSKGNIATATRGSMPPPRQPSATLAWDQNKVPSPKEAWSGSPRENYAPAAQKQNDVEVQFEHLLDSLQVPASVRMKFATVSQDVKTSILSSTFTSNPTILSSLGLPVPPQPKENPKMKKKLSTPLLRKAKSSAEMNSPGNSPQLGKTYDVEGEGFVIVASPMSSPNPNFSQGAMSPPLGFAGASSRGQSMDIPRPATMRQSVGPSSSSGSNGRPISMSIFGPSSSTGSVTSLGRGNGKGLGIAMGEQPEAFVQWLSSYKGTDLNMEVSRAKKLRMLLRHESTDWVTAFLEQGGYTLILTRLQDLLDVEWREEQHDDQMLYELTRCVKALSTSEVGKAALRSSFPAPYPALSQLLFSEKKPGDLASRQIIIELWSFLFDLFPPRSTSGGIDGVEPGSKSGKRPTAVRFDEQSAAAMNVRTGAGADLGRESVEVDILSEVRRLLVPELPDPAKDHHEFVTQAHRPRVFKALVGELSDICRDYFWIMCHASNTLWDLTEVDDSLVEKPVAPGGATGGVEFEAMNYVTTHFKLLNSLCQYQALEDGEKALTLHMDLLSSGMDRILVTLRKASTTYYPTLHLELARYVSLLRAASPNHKLPYLIGKMVGPPPEEVRRFESRGVGREWLPMPSAVGMGIGTGR